MSEELARVHSATGVPVEPKTPACTQAVTRLSSAGSHNLPGTSSGRPTGVPGGGLHVSKRDMPGDPYATLCIIATDWLLAKKVYSAPRPVPSAIDAALAAALKEVEACGRCVLVVSGGSVMPQACMQDVVKRMPGGLDSFGRGRPVEVMVKEPSAEWGNMWESALLIKMVAKRQASLVRFGSVVVVTAASVTAPTQRVFEKAFEDWRKLEGGGQAAGGRDLPIDVRTVPITVDEESLTERAAALDERWFKHGLETYEKHPSWPAHSVLTTLGPACTVTTVTEAEAQEPKRGKHAH